MPATARLRSSLRLTSLIALALVAAAATLSACGVDDEPAAPQLDADGGADVTDDAAPDTADDPDAAPDATPDAEADTPEPDPFPATAIVRVQGQFESAEGITFNGEGELYVVADTDLWRVRGDGAVEQVADLGAPVGLASIGPRDILVAEFGTLAANDDGPNDDGSILRVTPEGDVTVVATGIGDPNFIYVRRDGSLLVSDDFTDIIYRVTTDGQTEVFLQGIQAPNGMVEAVDRSALYVAQTFASLAPLTFDRRVWRVALDTDGNPGTPQLLGEVGGLGANDGVALDAEGRLYVACNIDGQVWRIDPADGSTLLIAQGIFSVASLAFGEGTWTDTSLFATQLFGGNVWEIPVGVGGAELHR